MHIADKNKSFGKDSPAEAFCMAEQPCYEAIELSNRCG